MEERLKKPGLENPTHRARLRGRGSVSSHVSTPKPVDPATIISDVHIRSRSTNPALTPKKAVASPVAARHLPKQAKSRVLKRQVTKPVYKAYPKHRRPLTSVLATTLAIFLATAGLIGVFAVVRANGAAKAQDKQQASQANKDTTNATPVSEAEPPSDITHYEVGADVPRFLSIAKIDVYARVYPVGGESKNLPAAPPNIFDIGWYKGSTKPDEPGAIVLEGYVSGPTKRGVFYNIGNMQAGDKISLERGDGKVFTYTVTDKEVYDNDRVDMGKVLKSAVPGKRGLNLITYSGRFNVRTNKFEQRMAVFAVQD
ncbi:MAG TPA: class F sortase [Candidatus Limnocylindrales bacterium]|nr:class F sortase [Candidatus Limnocylindrales bacterium]